MYISFVFLQNRKEIINLWMVNQQYIDINLNPIIQVTAPSPANRNPFLNLVKQVNDAGLHYRDYILLSK